MCEVSYGLPIDPVRACSILLEKFQYGTSDSHQDESVIESMNLGKGTNILFSWFQQEEDTEGNDYGKQTNNYGNTGCQAFKGGMKNWQDFCLKIKIPSGNY